MANVIPHLSRDGWMSNPINIISKLFEYYITSEYSQSNTFRGYIASLKYDLENGKSISDKKDNITRSLKTLYERYFDIENVNVEVDLIKEDSIDIINMYVEVKFNNKTYTLNNNIKTTNNVIGDIEEAIAKIHIV